MKRTMKRRLCCKEKNGFSRIMNKSALSMPFSLSFLICKSKVFMEEGSVQKGPKKAMEKVKRKYIRRK